ncbi:MAG TPA: type III secretion system cytoplasmic ring protein SctQ [Ramlibacter sp.]|uniref:type III secretion system cytoplasmic ring protein SctQ n=1 Tax=Ramlibacter sp. TaxID=1917967 RepID=UPI002B681552|nr:type III secretion system cytoplasmic ring protein SctQ [Ramlibacter sp.]HVZ45038.1 type III secretion system cytoplasmic ring protein SctQ [Ramlibacter sp.]
MIAEHAARPLALPNVPRDVLGTRNVLCRCRTPMEAHWLGEDWMFELCVAREAAPAECFVEFDWGGARVFVGLGADALDRVTARCMADAEPADWPMPVLLAALEYAASELAVIVESATRKGLRMVSVAGRPEAESLEAYGWRARSEQGEIGGELLLEATASRFLAAALREQPPVASDTDFGALPLRARLAVGWVDLSASALRTLATRDVVLLDECFLAADNRLMLLLGPRLGVMCGLEGRVLQVLEGVQEIMADVDDSMATASGLIDDVPVRLTFDLGEREISLGDLRSLQPGYLFNLGRDPKSTVSIRANGRLIGEGELVDIEGRVGVSVLNFNLGAE